MANDVSYFKIPGDNTQYSFNDADAESRVTTLNNLFSQQRTSPTNYSDRASNIYGGYIKVGNLVFVSITFSANATFSGAQYYLGGLPIPTLTRAALAVHGQASNAPHMQASVENDGNIRIFGSVTNGETIALTGVYFSTV